MALTEQEIVDNVKKMESMNAPASDIKRYLELSSQDISPATEQPQDAVTASSQDVLAQYKAGQITQQQAREQLRGMRPTAAQYDTTGFGGKEPSVLEKIRMAASTFTEPIGMILPKTQDFLFGYEQPKEREAFKDTPEFYKQAGQASVEGITQLVLGRIMGGAKVSPSVAPAAGLSLAQKAVQGSKGLLQSLPTVAKVAGTFGAGRAAESLIEGETPKEAIGKGLQTGKTSAAIDIGLRSLGGAGRVTGIAAKKLGRMADKSDLAVKMEDNVEKMVKKVMRKSTLSDRAATDKAGIVTEKYRVKLQEVGKEKANLLSDYKTKLEAADNTFANQMKKTQEQAKLSIEKSKGVSEKTIPKLVNNMETAIDKSSKAIKQGVAETNKVVSKAYKIFEKEHKVAGTTVDISKAVGELERAMAAPSVGGNPAAKQFAAEIKGRFEGRDLTAIPMKEATEFVKLLQTVGYRVTEGQNTMWKDLSVKTLGTTKKLVDNIDKRSNGRYRELSKNYGDVKETENVISKLFGEKERIAEGLTRVETGLEKATKGALQQKTKASPENVWAAAQARRAEFGKYNQLTELSEKLGLPKTSARLKAAQERLIKEETSLRNVSKHIDELDKLLSAPTPKIGDNIAVKTLSKEKEKAMFGIADKSKALNEEKRLILKEIKDNQTEYSRGLADYKEVTLAGRKKEAEKWLKHHPQLRIRNFGKELALSAVGLYTIAHILPPESSKWLYGAAAIVAAGAYSPRLAQKSIVYAEALKKNLPNMKLDEKQSGLVIKALNDIINQSQQ